MTCTPAALSKHGRPTPLARMTWRDFTTAHPQAVCFIGPAKRAWPKGLRPMDQAGQFVSAPYGLLAAILKKRSWRGDWTMEAKQGAALIKVVDPQDVADLVKTMGATRSVISGGRLPGCNVRYDFDFSAAAQKVAAKALGYDLL